MNRSQEKQIFVLGKLLRRNVKSVKSLYYSGKLKLPSEVLNTIEVMLPLIDDSKSSITEDELSYYFDKTFKSPSEEQLSIKRLIIS